MSAIIKATEHHNAVQSIAFNFDDMATRANAYLDKVRAEASRILETARQEAEVIRQKAEEEGHQAGQLEVAQLVEGQLAQKLTTLLPALRQVIAEIQFAKQAWLGQWEKSSLRVATSIAERLIRRELCETPDIPLTLIREALELAAGSPNLRIYLNPNDHQTLEPRIQALIEEFTSLAETELIPDAQITPGGCRVETRFGVIDQQWETQLKRIEEELSY
jgi:flagellar assembly protein FliH